MTDGALQDTKETRLPPAPADPVAKPAPKAYPGIGQAVILIVAMTFLQLALTIPFLFVGIRHWTALGLPTLIGTAVAIVFGYSRNASRGRKFSDIFPLNGISSPVLLSLLLTVVGLIILNLALTGLVVRVLPPPKLFSDFMRETIRGQQPFAIFLFAAIILPIGEEFLFRGLILHGFLSRYRATTAIVASALLFAFMHGNPWQLVAGLFMGTFLAWCFVRTRSLIPCFFAHIANNSIAFLLPRLQSLFPDLTKRFTLHIFWVDFAGLVFAVSGIYLLKSFFDAHSLIQLRCDKSEYTKENK